MIDRPGLDGEPPSFDTTIAHPGRVYDYLLGGKDNYDADRQAARRLLRAAADVQAWPDPAAPVSEPVLFWAGGGR